MLSYLGFDVRQSSMAVQFELKSFSILFKPRDIISILPTSFFSVPTVSYGLVFFRSDSRPKREGKKNSFRNYFEGNFWSRNSYIARKKIVLAQNLMSF